MEPKLYLCPTPIGNLEDITLRTIKTLRNADVIYAEDTRNSIKLLKHYKISKPLLSCHDHNEAQHAEGIASKVISGIPVAYISDAGMPGISDPGARLIFACIERNIPFEVLPGPSAAIVAAVVCGLPCDKFRFEGFLPRTAGDLEQRLESLKNEDCTMIFYESPLRVYKTLSAMLACFGDRPAVLMRELTKLHEETVRGTLSSLAGKYLDSPPKGECIIAVGQCAELRASGEHIDFLLMELLQHGLSSKDAAKLASGLLNISKNDAYKRAVELKRAPHI